MISGIRLRALRNGEFIQFIRNFLEFTLKNDPAKLNVQARYDALLKLADELEELFVKESYSDLTQELVALDARRDKAVIGINWVVKGYCNHFDADTAKHADILARQIEHYSKAIARENYIAETPVLNKLLSDFKEKPELEAAINALQLRSWFDELAEANASFLEAYLQRAQKVGSIDPTTQLEKREQLYPAYYELRDLINSQFTISRGAPAFAKITAELNGLIDMYKKTIAGRTGNGNGGEEATSSTA